MAAAAGVNHALVHRYFGTKHEMVGEILAGEATAMSAMARPEADTVTSLAALREVFGYVLTGGRTSLLLMLRAAIDGLAPERILDGSPLRPLDVLARWLEQQSLDASETDPRVVAMVLGAALMGLASVQPMLTARKRGSGGSVEALRGRARRYSRWGDRRGAGPGSRPGIAAPQMMRESTDPGSRVSDSGVVPSGVAAPRGCPGSPAGAVP
jgi:AcrR family transcriptional regulator